LPFCINCGQKIDEDQKICDQCGNSLEKQNVPEKLRTNFYVPIEYSDVKDEIPFGNDIIYSTLFSVNTHSVNPRSGGMHGFKLNSYTTHALFTENGITYQKSRRGVLKPDFIPWHKLTIFVGHSLGFQDKMTTYTFALTRHPDYESTQNFEMRLMKFYLEFYPHVVSEKRKYKGKHLKQIEKAYKKITEAYGDELIEFYKTNEDYEEFQKMKKEKMEEMPKWAKFLVKNLD